MNDKQLIKLRESFSFYLSSLRRHLPNEIKTYKKYFSGLSSDEGVIRFASIFVGSDAIDEAGKDEILALYNRLAELDGFKSEQVGDVIIPTYIYSFLSNMIMNTNTPIQYDEIMGVREMFQITPNSILYARMMKSRNPNDLITNLANAISQSLAQCDSKRLLMTDALHPGAATYYNLLKLIEEPSLEELFDRIATEYDFDIRVEADNEEYPLLLLERVLVVIDKLANDDAEVLKIEWDKNLLMF